MQVRTKAVEGGIFDSCVNSLTITKTAAEEEKFSLTLFFSNCNFHQDDGNMEPVQEVSEVET